MSLLYLFYISFIQIIAEGFQADNVKHAFGSSKQLWLTGVSNIYRQSLNSRIGVDLLQPNSNTPGCSNKNNLALYLNFCLDNFLSGENTIYLGE